MERSIRMARENPAKGYNPLRCTFMLTGTVQVVLSSDVASAEKAASKLGKKHESDWVPIYYQKTGEKLRSVLVPRPDKLLEQAQVVSISDFAYLVLPGAVGWQDGELALMIEAGGVDGELVGDPASYKYFSELSIGGRAFQEVVPFAGNPRERGFVFVDRVFPVTGVGTVVLGFTFTDVSVHDRFTSLPQGKEVEVRSIQVLDEDQDHVGVGVRVGLALKGASADELKGIYALSKESASFSQEVPAEFHPFKWAPPLPARFHVFTGGVRATATLEGGVMRSDTPIPRSGRGLVVDVNAKPKSPRVLGGLLLNG